MKKVKNGEIEFWRFVFVFIIVLYHSLHLGFNFFENGGMCVDFFFLVTGYLTMNSIEKLNSRKIPCENVGKETAQFIFKKIKGIYPELIASMIIAMGYIFVVSDEPAILKIYRFINTIPTEILMLRMTGAADIAINGPIWYISAMLIALVILYPLLRKHKSMMLVLIPVISGALIAIDCHSGGLSIKPTVWLGITCRGTYRAIAEIGLGALCYFFAQKIAGINFNKFGRFAVSAVKWICWIFIIRYLIKSTQNFDVVCLIAFFVAIAIAFSGKSIGASLYNNKLFYFLGSFSMPMFLGHFFFTSNSKYSTLNNVLPADISDKNKLIIYLACVFCTAAVIFVFGRVYRKMRPSIINLLKKLFTKNEKEAA